MRNHKRPDRFDALYPPAYLPVIPSGKPHALTCALDGGSREFKPDTVGNCTVPPRTGSEMPTIWAMGDSHSGHLQGMLYELHQQLGIGVHLVETPGWSFPLPAGTQFKPRSDVYNSIYPRFQPGDIVHLAHLHCTVASSHRR
jgi:hypothetical protein